MELKKFATWEYLIPCGLILWVVTWLVTFVAFFIKLAAVVMVIGGIVDFILFRVQRNKQKNNLEQPEKENGQS